MKKRLFAAKTAAVFTAASLLLTMSGCAMFRPASGIGRDDITEASDTKDTQKTPPQTSDTSDTSSPVSSDVSDSETATAKPPETTAPVPQEKRVSILAVGDNIIHEAVFLDAQKRAADGADYDFLPMYEGVSAQIAAADIAFINHETPLAGAEYGISGYPTFNAPREAAEALVDVGFDVINLANNHILDKRVVGARATVEYVQSLSVTELGVYLDTEDYNNIRVTEANGLRIAWVAFSYGSNNPYDPATANIIMPLMNDDTAIAARIADARKVADFVIVSAHFGPEEDQATVKAEHKRLAGVMANAGADVIIGHHPHVLHGVEWITRDDGQKTLVAYSLGNFLSTQYYARNMVGGMLTFDVVMDEDGNCSVETPLLRPTVTHYSTSRDALQIYMLEDYSESLAAAHGCKLHTTDFSLDWIYRHVRSRVDGEFLPEIFDT